MLWAVGGGGDGGDGCPACCCCCCWPQHDFLFSPSAPSLSFPDSLTAVAAAAAAARFCYSLSPPPSVVTIAPARLLLRLLLWPPPPQKEKKNTVADRDFCFSWCGTFFKQRGRITPPTAHTKLSPSAYPFFFIWNFISSILPVLTIFFFFYHSLLLLHTPLSLSVCASPSSSLLLHVLLPSNVIEKNKEIVPGLLRWLLFFIPIFFIVPSYFLGVRFIRDFFSLSLSFFFP